MMRELITVDERLLETARRGCENRREEIAERMNMF